MKFLVVLCAAVAFASAEPGILGYGYPTGVLGYSGLLGYSPVATQYHAQDGFGQASYGHASGLQAHHAVQDAAGNKVGSYSHVAPNGQLISTNYVADANGYRALTNGLPAGAQETPEVVAARQAHLAEVEAVKSRSRRSAQVSLVNHPLVTYPYVGAATYSHVIAKREANPQTPASTAPLSYVQTAFPYYSHYIAKRKANPQTTIVAHHVANPAYVSYPYVGSTTYSHVIGKREANPQTPASTAHLPYIQTTFPYYSHYIAKRDAKPQTTIVGTYPYVGSTTYFHAIGKREANPQTPASTAHLPYIQTTFPYYSHYIAKREAKPQTTIAAHHIANPVYASYPYVGAATYSHVIAKREAKPQTPASTAHLPATKVVSPVVVSSVHPVVGYSGLYNPLIVG